MGDRHLGAQQRLALFPSMQGNFDQRRAEASGPVPPFDPQRLNAAGSVLLTRPSLAHFVRTGQEFSWRAEELFAAIAGGDITVEVGGRYPLAEAARAHQDLQGRKTAGSIVLLPEPA